MIRCHCITLLIILAAAVASRSACAQRNWLQVSGTARPTAQVSFDLVYDLVRDRCVLFGGRTRNPNPVTYDETWEFDGASWLQRLPQNRPSARHDSRLALAPGGGVLMFGGTGLGGVLDETWIWDGTDWTQQFPSVSPPPMSGFAMWYDFVRNRVVLFGNPAETWQWNGTNWSLLVTAHSPPARTMAHAVYDVARDRAVMFGGRYASNTQLGDTWEFDGFDWQQRTPATSPAPRHNMRLAYDLMARRTIMFGGNVAGPLVDETWEWDGYDWHRIYTSAMPAGRAYHAIAFEWSREQAVIFGGNPVDDTWIYVQESEGRFTPLGYGCAGANGVPSLTAAPGTVPLGGQTFDVQLGNLPTQAQVAIGMLGLTELPGVSLAPIGLPGCHQFVSADLAVWVTAANGAATWPLMFPATPSLQGAQFYLQAVVPDPGANQLGLTVSSAAACTIG